MPFLLILFGVLGGAFTFGFIGVFIGPTLLAVGYRLVNEWASTHHATAVEKVPAQCDVDSVALDPHGERETVATPGR